MKVLAVMKNPHILIVEDDPEISALISKYLTSNDMRVSVAASGPEMDRVLADTRINLVVLDLMLPGEDGLSICRRLRASSALPIIMVTAQKDEIERIIGLEMGADDYIGKPFNPRELLARIRAVLRRHTDVVSPHGPTMLHHRFEGWHIDIARRRVFDPSGARITLTGAELDLLLVFCERSNRVLTRDQLIDLTQGRTANPLERSIDILISRLRQKLEKDPKDPEFIQTVRATGYLFSPQVETE